VTRTGLHVLAGAFAGLLLLLAAGPVAGQVAGEPLSFDEASVKVATPVPGNPINSIKGGPGTSDPELIVYRAVPFEALIARVFDIIYEFRLEGPDWMRRQLYDITAKVPAGATKEQANQMLLNLLKERFHLKLHHETHQVGGYEFTVAKGGSKLKKSLEPDAPEVPPYSSHVKHIDNDFPQVEPGYSAVTYQNRLSQNSGQVQRVHKLNRGPNSGTVQLNSNAVRCGMVRKATNQVR
jgi:uncharacterized protein (TIGR03435 family)